MQPLFCPVACGFVKSEFVDYIRKDLSKQCILKVLYGFSVVKVQGVQMKVVVLDSTDVTVDGLTIYSHELREQAKSM